MEEIALSQMKANNWQELYSVWISLVRQGIRAHKILPDAAYFQQLKELEQLSNQHLTEKFNKF